MIRIAISQAAFEAVVRTLPFGSVSFENKIDQNGDRLIWLERRVVNRLRSLRGPGESYSDVFCGWSQATGDKVLCYGWRRRERVQ